MSPPLRHTNTTYGGDGMAAKDPAKGSRMARGTLEDAEAACEELMAALAKVGVTLPSLGLDPLPYGGEFSFALVELGRCNVPTARALAAALRQGRA